MPHTSNFCYRSYLINYLFTILSCPDAQRPVVLYMQSISDQTQFRTVDRDPSGMGHMRGGRGGQHHLTTALVLIHHQLLSHDKSKKCAGLEEAQGLSPQRPAGHPSSAAGLHNMHAHILLQHAASCIFSYVCFMHVPKSNCIIIIISAFWFIVDVSGMEQEWVKLRSPAWIQLLEHPQTERAAGDWCG